jgi:hypothetical protein
MSSTHIAHVFSLAVHPHDKLVLWAIAEATDPITGEASVPQSWIKAVSGLSLKSVQRAVRRLSDAGMLEVGKREMQNTYAIPGTGVTQTYAPDDAPNLEKYDEPTASQEEDPALTRSSTDTEAPPQTPVEKPIAVKSERPRRGPDQWAPSARDWSRAMNFLGSAAEVREALEMFPNVVKRYSRRSEAELDGLWQRYVQKKAAERNKRLLGS